MIRVIILSGDGDRVKTLSTPKISAVRRQSAQNTARKMTFQRLNFAPYVCTLRASIQCYNRTIKCHSDNRSIRANYIEFSTAAGDYSLPPCTVKR